MNAMTPMPSTDRPEAAYSTPPTAGSATPTDVARVGRVLRNTYALLSLTLLFSAAVAAASVAFQLPAPGILLTLGGYFGLIFANEHGRNQQGQRKKSWLSNIFD